MMSSTSANVDVNVNPVYADVIKVDFSEFLHESDALRMFEDWRNWTLQDIIRILKDMAKPGECHGVTGVVMGNIVLRKLLEAAAVPNVPFEVIEETVHTVLEAPAFCQDSSVLTGFKTFGRQDVCDFFKQFVKRGIDVARYYELINIMLTYRLNNNYPEGFVMSKQNGFNDEVLAKLPSEMQKQLNSYTFHKDDDNMDRRLCYSLLTGESVEM